MRIQDLLLEAGKSVSTVLAPDCGRLSAQQMRDIIVQAGGGAALKQYMQNNKSMIYRGWKTAQGDIVAQDTLASTRMSENTHNFVTLLSSVLPSWKGYPPRSKGVSCSSSMFTAQQYAGETSDNVFVIIPTSNVTTVYTGADDFWFSLENLGASGMDVSDFNAALNHLHNWLHSYTDFKGIPLKLDTAENILTMFRVIDQHVGQGDIDFLDKANNRILNVYANSDFETMEEMVNWLLTPGGKIFTNGQINPAPRDDEEVFVSGTLIAIRKRHFNRMVAELG